MRAVAVVDTSILVNLLRVPGFCGHHHVVTADMRSLLRAGTAFVLPLVTLIETGNHVAKVSGGQRHGTVRRFVQQSRLALTGQSPFVLTPAVDHEEVLRWIEAFPDLAQSGVGFGDAGIIATYERQCRIHAGRRVFIWSLDGHLSGYDRPPTVGG